MNHSLVSAEAVDWSTDPGQTVRWFADVRVIMSGDKGVALVTALLAMLVLSAVGIMITVTVAEDMQVASNHYEIVNCLYVSEAGLNYAIRKIQAVPTWTGLPEPGRWVGSGRFSVAVSDSTNGVPLPAGQKRINVTAHQGGTEREIEVIVQ